MNSINIKHLSFLFMFIIQISVVNKSSSQCVFYVTPTTVSLPSTGGSEYIFVDSGSCESYSVSSNDSWFYFWMDYYEHTLTVYADPNHEGYRTGTITVHDSWNNEDIIINVSQDWGCVQLQSPGDISGLPGNSICYGASAVFSITPLEGATSYVWKLNGNTISNTYGSTETITFTAPVTSISTLSVAGYNDCGIGVESSRDISVLWISSDIGASMGFSQNNICPGTNVTLSVSGGYLGTNASWKWYSGSCGGTYIGSGTSIVVNPSSTTNYYVRAEGVCNTTSCVYGTLTVKTLSTAPSTINISQNNVCQGTQLNLSVSGGNLGNGASWKWYTGSCGGTLVGTGSSINVTPTVTTTYYVRAEDGCNTTACASGTVNIKSLSIPPSLANIDVNNICSGFPVNLSVVGGNLGTGASWKWYSGSCGGTFVGTGSSIQVNPASTTTYFVRAEGECNTTACESVTVTVKSLSNAPISINLSQDNVCPGTNVTLSFNGGNLGTGASWKWYMGSCGGTLVGTGTSIDVSPGVTTTYFVRAEGDCNATACASRTLTVQTPSTAPSSLSLSNNNVCPGTNITLTANGGSLGTGASWKWYSGSCGGTFIGSGASIIVNPQSTTTYYVRAEWDCNVTACASATLIVKTTSSSATSINLGQDNVCPGTNVTLSINGGSLGTGASWKWYSGSCGGTYIGIGASIVVNPTSTTNYFVRAEGDCNTTECVSRTLIVKTISTAPSSINLSQNNVCPGTNITLSLNGGSLGTGASWKWYSGSCDGSYIGGGTSIVVNPSSTTSYFVRAEGECNNTICASVVINVKVLAVITVHPSDETVPPNQDASLFVNATGTNLEYKWQSSSDGLNSWIDLAGLPAINYNTNTLTIRVASTPEIKFYRCKVSADGCPSYSNGARLEIVNLESVGYSTGTPTGTTGEIVNNNGVVGSIPGQFSVSPTGAATYTIPIECPSGINGLTPLVSLNYNSQAGNGIAGWGWNLTGTSAITRTPKVYYYDSETRGIKWNETDNFSIDGTRIFIKNLYPTGSNQLNADSIEYKKESDNSIKIMGYNFAENGPESFKVWTSDGKVLEYSQRQNVSLIEATTSYFQTENYPNNYYLNSTENFINEKTLGWYLNSIKDAFGNQINFNYENESIFKSTSQADSLFYNINDPEFQWPIYDLYNGNSYLCNVTISTSYKIESFRLKEVIYAGGNYKIALNYETRNDVIKGFLSGEELVNSKRLSSISVVYDPSNNPITVKHYTLSYISDLYSKLEKVQLAGLNNEKFNYTVFDWSNDNYTFSSDEYDFADPSMMSSRLTQGYTYYNHFYYPGDFNGDGISDFFVTFLYSNNGGQSFIYDWAVYLNPDSVTTLPVLAEGEIPSNKQFYIFDNDLDGKSELYFQYSHTEYSYNEDSTMMYSYPYVKFGEYEFNDQSFVRNTDHDINIRLLGGTYNDVKLLFGNFDGDGKPNLVLLNSNLSYNNSRQFKNGCISFSPGSPSSYFLSDINGNGKVEIVFLKTDRIEFWEYINDNSSFAKILTNYAVNQTDYFYVGDFNGDGNTDLLAYDTSLSAWKLLISDGSNLNGTIMSLPPLSSPSNYNYLFENYIVSDFNQDGKSDIMELNQANKLKLYISDGNYFILKFSDINTGNSHHSFKYCVDSNSDLTIDCFAGLWDPIFYTVSPDHGFNQINNIYTGIGITNNLNYQKSYRNDNPINTIKPESDNKYGIFSAGSSVKTVSEIHTRSTTYFDYKEPMIQANGRGFIGFGKINKIEKLGNLTSTSYEHFSLVQKGYLDKYELTPDTIIRLINSNIVSKIFNYYSSKNIEGDYYILLDSTASFDLTNSTKKIKKLLNYNNPILPSIIKNQFWANNTLESEITDSLTYSNITSSERWIFNQLLQKKTRQKRPGEIDYVRRYDYDYYPSNGALKYEFQEKGSLKEIKKSFEYDSFGNVISVTTVTPSDANDNRNRIIHTSYTADGRFPETYTDVLGNSESYIFSGVTGQIQSKTDINGFTTTYHYTGLGMLYKTIYHDNTEENKGLYWIGDLTNTPEGSEYFSIIKSSGKSPVTSFYDRYGKELRTVSTGLSGNTIYSDKLYDASDRLWKKSLPYFADASPLWTQIAYDDQNRISGEERPDGSFTNYTYSERETETETGKASSTQTKIKRTNSLGEIIESTDNAGHTVLTKYFASGFPKEISIGGEGHKTRFSYDIYGNRDTIYDPDAGKIISTYNALGYLISQKDNKNNTTNYTYDLSGRMLTSLIGSNLTSYIYDENIKGVISEVSDGYNTVNYDYDIETGLPENVTEILAEPGGNKTLTKTYNYDQLGRLTTEIWSTGYQITSSYNEYGYLYKIADASRTLWEAIGENALGQITNYSQGSFSTTQSYNEYGDLQGMVTPGVRNMSYGFDDLKNLHFRQDNLTNQREEFAYDNLNRLTGITYYLNGIHQSAGDKVIAYNNLGNITGKTGIALEGNIGYGEDGAGPHALTSISALGSYMPLNQSISYTDFNKVEVITDTLADDTYRRLDFKYGIDHQRRRSLYNHNSTTIKKYFFGDYEEVNNGNTINKYFYIDSPTGLCGIYVIEGDTAKLYHTFTDHLGSLTEVVNASTGDILKQSFDAWGNKRSSTNWQAEATYSLFAASGFTGHEHLEPFDLINMNGRVYDPVLGRFLSPDPFIQLSDFSQSFNRYSYCLNNPLVNIDPSGEIIFTILAAIFCPPLLPVAIAADIGGGINLFSKFSQGKIHNLGDAAIAYGIGAGGGALAYTTGGAILGVVGAGGFIGGAAAAGTAYTYGTMFTSMGNTAYFGDPMPTAKQFITGATISMATGGLLNGLVAVAHGRDFWTGAAKIVPNNLQSPPLNSDKGKVNLSIERPEIKALHDNHSFTLTTSEPLNSYTVEGNTINLQRPTISGYKPFLSEKLDLYHNFPKVLDPQIVQQGSWAYRVSDYVRYNNIGQWFEAPGIIDGVRGVYQIGINESGIIFHRAFIPF